MDTCDVVIVGGGPAGSSCALKLREAGLDVIVMDAANFPRDKVCAGWITPQVIGELRIDVEKYRRGRTFQPITGFRTGLIAGAREVETVYDSPISFGIRRCEFDEYLLQRAGARLKLGTSISSIRREGGQWIVNGSVRAAMLVGAGGHFCPVARWLNPSSKNAPLVVAQEVEFPVEHGTGWTCAPEMPELYFCRDLKGYGWCFRKEHHLNVGLGRLDRRSLPNATTEFVRFLEARHKVPRGVSWHWRGHAYILSGRSRRRMVEAGVMLVGDAAGLAYPQSGEGIRPAVESGLLAASVIIEAKGCYTRERLISYETRLLERFGDGSARWIPGRKTIADLSAVMFPWMLDVRWFVRNLLLDRWFLHAHEPGLVIRRETPCSQDDTERMVHLRPS
jgi:geranylgeranyl reductase family protein